MKRNLFSKLMLSFLSLIVLPITIVSYVAYAIATDIINNNISQSILQNVRQYSLNSEFMLKDAERVIYTMFFDTFKAPNEIKVKLENFNTADEYERNQINHWIQGELNKNTIYRDSINGIYLMDVKGNLFSSGNVLVNNPDFSSFKWFRSFMQDQEKDGYWSSAHKINGYTNTSNANVVTFAKKIYSPYGLMIGVAWLDLNERFLENIYTSGELVPNLETYIFDQQFQVVSSSDKDMVTNPLDVNNRGLFSKIYNDYNGYYFVRHEGQDKLVAYSTIQPSGWKMATVVPVKYIFVDSDRVKNIIIILALVCVFMSAIIAFFFSRRVTRPIEGLISLMEKAAEGNLSVRAAEDNSDEIGKLNKNFNMMIREIENLISSVYISNLKQKEAELASLEAQINPHFLYNTLQSIKWMSDMYKAVDIGDMAVSLAKIFRFSIKGAPVVSLYEEIQHVNYYVNIQKYRYGDRFEVKYDIPEDLMNCQIPKLMIQPLVENAIYHGIEMKEEPGLIRIWANTSDQTLRIGVEDTGIGIPYDKWEHILQTLASKDHHVVSDGKGLGLKNIHERIQLLYGNEYGLQLRRVKEGGTLVMLVLPIKYD
jgi:two-component system sensor histidine kinase YesM